MFFICQPHLTPPTKKRGCQDREKRGMTRSKGTAPRRRELGCH